MPCGILEDDLAKVPWHGRDAEETHDANESGHERITAVPGLVRQWCGGCGLCGEGDGMVGLVGWWGGAAVGRWCGAVVGWWGGAVVVGGSECPAYEIQKPELTASWPMASTMAQ